MTLAEKITAVPIQNESVISHDIENRVALGTRTECSTLTMLERMRLTCWVLPQGKALNISV